MGDETWVPVPGYEGRYEVSDAGRVRSWLRWRNLPVPRLLTPVVHSRGYREMTLLDETGNRQGLLVHRIVLLAFSGPAPIGTESLHANGDRSDNRLANLRYGTSSENQLDMVRHGTHHNARKTHCMHGHQLTPANVYVTTDGRRNCRTCRRAADARRHARDRSGAGSR